MLKITDPGHWICRRPGLFECKLIKKQTKKNNIMKQSLSKTVRKNSFIILLCLTVQTSLFAQSTSYNANTIPVLGTNCTALGYHTLLNNSSGNYNVALGFSSSIFSNSFAFIEPSSIPLLSTSVADGIPGRCLWVFIYLPSSSSERSL